MRLPLACLLLIPAFLLPAAADPVISEFCASNQNGLQDNDGDRSDWVEIFNPDPVAFDLTNWYLTDNSGDRTKWQFPATVIPPRGYLVIFASSKNRRVPGQALHTNFSLSAGGEYLGLIRPDGATASSEFTPQFPAQFPDFSYGTPSNVTETVLFAENAPVQWIVPISSGNPASTWRTTGFNSAGWTTSEMGLGYDRDISGTNYRTQIGAGSSTEADMGARNNPSCYVRIPFTVPTGTEAAGMKLRVKYDDGFVAWLNGQPLMSGATQVRRNAPSSLAWNSTATAAHLDSAAAVFEDFNVSESLNLLAGGTNVLALHAFNRQVDTTDFFIRAELVAETTVSGPAPAPGYFATPTPGARNSGLNGVIIPQKVVFSQPAGTFSTESFSLSLSGAISGQQIRYTLDGSLPGAGSTLYAGPITINNSTVVRARVYNPTTGALGFTAAANYEKLAATLSSYSTTGQAFRSALPIVVLNNRGGGELQNNNLDQSIRIQIYDRDASGYATLAPGVEPVLAMNANTKLRGRSSADFPKKSYGIELLDENGAETAAEVLGMPAGEDWALIGCYDFDRAFMRNAWIYEASRQMGRWAPRTRLVEVFFNQNGDSLSYTNADYRGVYILCENIRRGPDRVDIAKIEPSDTTQPGVSGGYIFKVDAGEFDEYIWRTNRNLPTDGTGGHGLVVHRPKRVDLPVQQQNYLKGYFQSFEDAVFTEASAGFSTRNYRNYIDSASWVDHNLFCTVTKNVDALRLSAYFHKDRNARMAAGPLWDFDRSANSTDWRDDNTNTWRGEGDATDYFLFSWWEKLFQDVEFRQLYVDRWQLMRRGALSNANVSSILEGYRAEFKPLDTDNPAKRDYARWYSSSSNNDITYQTNLMKNWLSTRSGWMDSQFATAPNIVRPPGPVAAGQTTAITVPSGAKVYYTTDGTDPRAEGGQPSASAIEYIVGSPVALSATMKITARTWRPGSFAIPSTNWSGPVEALYLVDEVYASAANLQVSAICYNPLAPDPAEAAAMPEAEAGAFEWIELKNTGAGAVNLVGVTLGEGAPVAEVILPAFTLAPGARGVVVKNRQAFTLRYGSAAAARIVAVWTGDGSLDNAGEAIHVYDQAGEVIAEFNYDDEDDWPERADGDGSALEFVGSGPFPNYEDPANWKASDAVHGSPGIDTPATSPVVVNEILANTVLPQRDAIELANPGDSPVDLGGWFIGNIPEATTAADYRMFRIPNGTVIPAGGHLLFDEADFNPNGEWNPTPGTPGEGEFSLDGYRGGKLWLISADPSTGKLRNFEQEVEWTPSLPGVPYGRFPDGTGAFAPLSSYTPAAANAAPRVGPVQVTEIQYHPSGIAPEFVEIANTGDTVQVLAGWTLRGDVDYDFPAGFTLSQGEGVVLVSFDPVLSPALASSFRSDYGVSEGVRLVGPWSAGDTLGDDSGDVRLRRAVPPPPDEPGFVGLMVEDEVNYLSQAPWPTTASGTGSSIRRIGVRKQGSDPSAWTASAPAPGSGVGGYAAWRLAAFGASGIGEKAGDPDGDGLPNFLEYLLGTDPGASNALAAAIDDNGGNPRFVLDYTLRKDRDDGRLAAFQTTGFEVWVPAENDAVTSDNGTVQARRAWLPVSDRGFLRLEFEEVSNP